MSGSASPAAAPRPWPPWREAARAHTASHETHNYLHGPMEPLDSQTACIVVGDDREVRLAHDVAALGCPTLLVTSSDAASSGSLHVLKLPAVPPLARPVLQILPVQVLAWRLATPRGLAADGFRYQQDDQAGPAVTKSIHVIGNVQLDVLASPVRKLPEPGGDDIVDSIAVRPAGAAGNVSLALAALGVPHRLFGAVGDDQAGRWVLAGLAELGLDADVTVATGQDTGISIALEAPGRERAFLTAHGVLGGWSAADLRATPRPESWCC